MPILEFDNKTPFLYSESYLLIFAPFWPFFFWKTINFRQNPFFARKGLKSTLPISWNHLKFSGKLPFLIENHAKIPPLVLQKTMRFCPKMTIISQKFSLKKETQPFLYHYITKYMVSLRWPIRVCFLDGCRYGDIGGRGDSTYLV